MASDTTGGDSVQNSRESETSDNQEYIERVKKFMKPLETRWNYIQSVILWEKPIHSLCYFIAMTALFGAMASGRFRLVLLLIVIIASSLLMDDVRTKVWLLLQQGGFGRPVDDADSRNTTLSFSRLCEKLAAVWSLFMTWCEKLNKLKTDSICKYYGILFGILLVVVFAYQYLPLMKIFYLTACALYFWPVIKHHGIHKTVKKTVEPFYMPFVIQWQHNRTKRQRDTKTKGEEGTGDSDAEFAEDFQPVVNDTAVNQDDPSQNEELSASEPPTPEPPLEVRFLEQVISSAVSQGLSSITKTQDQNDDDDNDNMPAGNAESATPDPESFDSSAVFLDDLQFSSISQGGDTLEFEGEFMEGLEFPDIDQNSDSESEHIDHEPVSNLQVDNKPKQVAIEEAQSKKSNDGVSKQTSGSSESVMTSSGNTDVSDYEMLDQSEAEGMTPTDETDNVDSSGRLGSVSNYVGKWLGY